MGIRATLRQRLAKLSAIPGFDPAQYWNDRYLKHGDTLSGPRCLGLTEAENAHDDAVKARAIIPAITANFGEIDTLSILHAGRGSGFFAEMLADAGAAVTGVDFSEDLSR